MFSSKILTHSCTMKHCIGTGYILVIFACNHLVHIAQILERDANVYFLIQMIKMAKKGKTVKFKNYAKNKLIKLPSMIYASFESILIPENSGKQNPDESYTNKYQNHVGYSFGYKVVCVGDQFNKHFKLYLGQDAIHKFMTNMIKER